MEKQPSQPKKFKAKLTKTQIEDIIALLTSRVMAIDEALHTEMDLQKRDALKKVRAVSMVTIVDLQDAILPKKERSKNELKN